MTEQWFLDLDGVRSGPYQTPEVMSLIAEGEVLPHHRISTSLKDASWMTILDWRLDQARNLQKKETKPYTPASTSEVVAFEEPELSITPIEIPPEVLHSPAPTPVAPEPTPERPTPAIKLDPIPTPQPPKIPEVDELPVLPFEPGPSIASKPSDDKPRRDPMAEMYDMLQNTKHKREAKQLHTAQISHSEPVSAQPSNSSGLGRVIAIGLGLALIGFALGQFFQQTIPQKEFKPQEQKSAFQTPTPTPRTEVIDRSNEKMTIKAVVQKKPEETVVKSMPGAKARTSPRDDRRSSDHEIEELKDLKKELQELKAMKDQLKDNPNPDDFSDGDANYPASEGLGPEGMVDSPAPGYPGEIPAGAPNRGVRQPQASPNPAEIHY